MIATAPVSDRRPTRGDVAVDSIEATLGRALLVAAGLAVILLTVIVVLLEANCILRLAGRLTRSLQPPDDRSGEPLIEEEED
jgi:hypothetical protein